MYTLFKKLQTDIGEEILNGTGKTIEFTPERSGWYYINADGRNVFTQEIKGLNWNKKWWILPWYVWILGVLVILFIIIYLIRRRNKSPISRGGVAFGTSVDAG